MRQLYPLAADEVEFLREAAAHYCATRCPVRTDEGSCPMLAWREGHFFGGALERVCKAPPWTWESRLGPSRGIALIRRPTAVG